MRRGEGAVGIRAASAMLLFAAAASVGGCAELERLGWPDVFAAGGPPSEQTVAAGLRQALEIGTERAAETLSAEGGFSADPRWRLGLPAPLDGVAGTLRRFGLGAQIDALEATMNRAAERAAGEAVPVFADAIRRMTLADAFSILRGGDGAATAYFREHTAGALRARFTPVVDDAMQSVGLIAQYDALASRYEALPIAKPSLPDPGAYVTDRTLDALFGVLAEEEAAIRRDPAARTTALLRRVFGGPDGAPDGGAPQGAGVGTARPRTG